MSMNAPVSPSLGKPCPVHESEMVPCANPLSVPGTEGNFVFPTWRDALANTATQLAAAYEHRERTFKAAIAAGLTYRQVGEAAGLSAAQVHKIVGGSGRVPKVDLDSPAVA